MDWKTMLAYMTGSVDEELFRRNEYLAAENRILRAHLPGRVPVRLEFVVRPPLGDGPRPGSGRPNGLEDSVQLGTGHHGSVGEGQRRVACGPSTTRGCVPRLEEARR